MLLTKKVFAVIHSKHMAILHPGTPVFLLPVFDQSYPTKLLNKGKKRKKDTRISIYFYSSEIHLLSLAYIFWNWQKSQYMLQVLKD